MTDVIHLPGSDYSLIKNKSKRMIFRIPSGRYDVRVSDWIVIVFNDLSDNVMVEIEDVGAIRFGDLTEEHASLSGYSSLDDLKKCLMRRYVTLDNVSILYFYKFCLMGVSEKVGE